MGADSKFAVITGASSGIGFELARLCVKSGIDVLIAADEADILDAAADLSGEGATVIPVRCDLSGREGVKHLLQHVLLSGRAVDYLFANAGRGLGGRSFLDQDIAQVLEVAHTNIEGTLYLLHAVARAMRIRGKGRILVTGAAANAPSPYHAVYGATEAFLNSFSAAVAQELRGSGVSLTCLMPGPTDTAFFERAGMQTSRVAAAATADAAEVARCGFEALMNGSAAAVPGWGNKLRDAMTHLAPDALLAQLHKVDAVERSAGS